MRHLGCQICNLQAHQLSFKLLTPHLAQAFTCKGLQRFPQVAQPLPSCSAMLTELRGHCVLISEGQDVGMSSAEGDREPYQEGEPAWD